MSNNNYGPRGLVGAWQDIVGGAWQDIVGAEAAAAAEMAPNVNPNTAPSYYQRHGHGGGYQGGYGAQFNGIPPRNMLVDRPGPTRADRVILPMSSGVNILPSTSAQITARPQNVAFRPERIVIGGSPGDWIVNDIKVGNQSQLSQSGDLPGEMFSSTMVDGFISFGTVQTAMDFVIQVTFIGDSEGGAPFFCGVLGTAAV